jgi:RNA polymerase sigma-70 factor (ECF subfamily)
VTALRVLPPRQVAVLVLRDVLGFHASEVVSMLDSTVGRSTAPKRRASLQRRHAAWRRERLRLRLTRRGGDHGDVHPRLGVHDMGALVALLTDDVFMSMPPMPFEYQGRDVGPPAPACSA